jgi:hypothetical protein
MVSKNVFGKWSRRQLLAGSAAVAGGLPAGIIANTGVWAQNQTSVKLTLPWIANGSNYWPVIGKKLGYFSKRGIDVDIARGFGSVAAAQAVANKQFDFETRAYHGLPSRQECKIVFFRTARTARRQRCHTERLHKTCVTALACIRWHSKSGP